jgi:epoxyqueuosine reductase
VCTWNSFAGASSEDAFLPRAGVDGAALIELMGMAQEEFSRRFKRSAVKRTKRRGLLRNVAVAPGSWGSPEAVPGLTAALDDEGPLVRGHAAWALGRIGTADALRERLGVDEDPWVRVEVELALRESPASVTLRGTSRAAPRWTTASARSRLTARGWRRSAPGSPGALRPVGVRR